MQGREVWGVCNRSYSTYRFTYTRLRSKINYLQKLRMIGYIQLPKGDKCFSNTIPMAGAGTLKSLMAYIPSDLIMLSSFSSNCTIASANISLALQVVHRPVLPSNFSLKRRLASLRFFAMRSRRSMLISRSRSVLMVKSRLVGHLARVAVVSFSAGATGQTTPTLG